jgi:uncharacterized protein YoxC
MTFDSTVNLGTIIHLVVLLVSIAITWGALTQQIKGIYFQLKEIKERLGCTEDDVEKQGEKTQSVMTRIASLETDVGWLKDGGTVSLQHKTKAKI